MFALTAAALLASCNLMDDQSIVVKERQYLANPAPAMRDFARINAQHKVIVGIIDTGVDYNHPLLVENLHFSLNRLFQWPTSFGYDVSGQDAWSYPAIVRTSDYNPDMKPEDKQKSIVDSQNIATLIKENPEFSKFLHPHRNVGQEVQTSAYHGTHVAGLASYDNPQIGIIGYRVLPFNTKYKDGKLLEQDQGDLFIDQIIKGSQAAVRDGARVLNMSLGMLVDREYSDLKKSAQDEAEHKARAEKLRQFALANPNVVIVVAAGNDGKWVDQDARLGMPCGADAPNILCVGATDEAGKIASFSNILMTEGAFVFGYGVNVLSTMPTTMCTSSAVGNLQNSAEYFKTAESKAKLVKKLQTDCKNLALKELSGTSMASPIIARQVAKLLIENPSLTGAQAIQALLAKASDYKMGPVSFPTLKVEKPSWSKKAKQGLSLRRDAEDFGFGDEEEEYFDFIVPQAN